jgi:hypothetical protein
VRSAPSSRTATPQKPGKNDRNQGDGPSKSGKGNATSANNAGGSNSSSNASDATKKEPLRAEVNNAFSVLDADAEDAAENEGDSNAEAESKDKEATEDSKAEEEAKSDVSAEEEEKIRSKVKGGIREFFGTGLKDDFKLTVQELSTPACNHFIVYDGFLMGLEAKDKERSMFSELLTSLYEQKALSAANIRKGFTLVLEQAEDLVFDSPKLLEQMAPILTQLIIANALSLSYLVSAATQPIQESGKAGKLLAEVLLAIQSAQGDDALKTMFKADVAPKLESCLQGEDATTFLKEKKLDILVDCL